MKTMDAEQRQLLFERIGAGAFVVLFAIGAWFLNQYEQARSRDIQRMSRVLEAQSALGAFASRYAVFPAASEGSMPLGLPGSDCISKTGIGDRSAEECRQGMLGLVNPAPGSGDAATLIYATFGADRQSLCSSSNGCLWYTIQFVLETSAIAPIGTHTATPKGIQ